MSWIICLVSFSSFLHSTSFAMLQRHSETQQAFLSLEKLCKPTIGTNTSFSQKMERVKSRDNRKKVKENWKKERIKLSRHSAHTTCELSGISSYTLHLSRVKSTRTYQRWGGADGEGWWQWKAREEKRKRRGKCCNSTICHFWWIASVYLVRKVSESQHTSYSLWMLYMWRYMFVFTFYWNYARFHKQLYIF